jgi:molybdate transport system regulatory protein
MLAPEETGLKTSARNCISGQVLRCDMTAIQAEVVLDIGEGRTLAASITAQSAKALAIEPGKRMQALFDSTHVILAID